MNKPEHENSNTPSENTDHWRKNPFSYTTQVFQANLAQMTAGMSPAALGSSFFSWGAQLAQAPGILQELSYYPMLHGYELMKSSVCSDSRVARGEDVRFRKEIWQEIPWRLGAETFLFAEQWWQRATTDIPGLPKHVERTVSFCIRQVLDALSPSNFVLTNPELFYETLRSGGVNLLRGMELAVEDMLEHVTGAMPAGAEHFIPGQQVAITPGRVIFSNHLIELIQYQAQTATVYKEPILILPAWIMKYYILDLSPHNSFVKWLVQQGHTVFIVSWRNPDQQDRNLGMDDYYRQGAMAAIDAVAARLPGCKINLMGYCLGGTLAMMVASMMARLKDQRLNSLSLLAAQGDFTDAGELMLFITESEVSFLKKMMWSQGYLDTKQMKGAFQMLRSYDLIWSKMLHDYLHGVRRGMIDLLAWNADATRMPYKMHSEYLEKLLLNNELARGLFKLENQSVTIENIQLPVFAAGTEKDHVAPWRSVFKIHLMVQSSVTFVLTNGGHNAGIVSEPDHPRRYHRILERKVGEIYHDPDQWLEIAEKREGSWWPSYHEWQCSHNSEKRVRAPQLDKNLPLAPGRYVLQK
ncbi:MAG: polyhydroxyalkanoic acid synthase [Legionellaceae bacterium]|nr:polyhydroxyalkanoic acid synthase [Legionellaceae bacterium]